MKLLQDFIQNIRKRPYAIEQLEEPYHYYRRDSDGLIDFKVGRDENGQAAVIDVEWNSTELQEDQWAVYDCMYNAEELTFPQFVEVVRRQAKASIRGDDPFVDDDADYLRGNREDAAAARDGQYDTVGREFTEETPSTPEVQFWSGQTQ